MGIEIKLGTGNVLMGPVTDENGRNGLLIHHVKDSQPIGSLDPAWSKDKNYKLGDNDVAIWSDNVDSVRVLQGAVNKFLLKVEGKKDTNNKVTVQLGEELFSFSNEQEWINKAQSWFSQLGLPQNYYICIDSVGRICVKGSEFMRATAEDTYPITVYESLVK